MKKTPDPYSIDADNPEWTDSMFKAARPAKEVFTETQLQGLMRLRGQRGPQKAPTKAVVKLRVDPDVVSYFRATGRGWQTRMNEALRQFIAEHPHA